MPGSFPQVQSMPGPDVLRVLRDPAAYQRLAQEVLQSSNSFQVGVAVLAAASLLYPDLLAAALLGLVLSQCSHCGH